MALLLKAQISEREAAGIFLGRLSRELAASWPKIFESIRPSFPSEIALVDNEQVAKGELFLAIVAAHVEGLEVVFPGDRADRLRSHITELLKSPPFCDARDEDAADRQEATLAEYRQAWASASAGGRSPDSALVGLLYERLGTSYSGREDPRADRASKTEALSAVLANFGVSWWRYLGRKYRILAPRGMRGSRLLRRR